MTSNAPPSVSPASFARSIAGDHPLFDVRRRRSAAGCRRAARPPRSNVTTVPAASATSPRAKTWLVTLTPTRASSCRAMAPAATRAAVSRALARSRMSRMSARPYLATPARSAWPGRGRVTGARRRRRRHRVRQSASASTRIVCCQFAQSRFRSAARSGRRSSRRRGRRRGSRRGRTRSPCGGRGRSRPGAAGGRA